jgi:hypothetical protein
MLVEPASLSACLRGKEALHNHFTVDKHQRGRVGSLPPKRQLLGEIAQQTPTWFVGNSLRQGDAQEELGTLSSTEVAARPRPHRRSLVCQRRWGALSFFAASRPLASLAVSA